MRQHLILAAAIGAAIVTGLGQTAARAGVTWTAINATGAIVSPFILANPGPINATGATLVLGSETIKFNPDNSSPYSGVYFGDTINVARSPFNGTSLTPTSYLVAQYNDPVTIMFASPQKSFGLLWGSVDTYNNLTIELKCSDKKAGKCDESDDSSSVTGSDIAKAAKIAADGSTSAFVTIIDTSRFDEIVLKSSQPAFEFVPQAVPEPVTLSILGTGLVGLGLAQRRRRLTTSC